MQSDTRVQLIRWLSILGWVIVQAIIAAGIKIGTLEPALSTVILVVIGSPFYIWLVHRLDHRFGLLGFRCLNVVAHKLPSNDAMLDEGEFRKSLRLEMLAITSGFAATLFLLCIQLYLEWDLKQSSRPGFVLETMAVLFFAASVLNLLQLVMYDFLLRTKAVKDGGGKIFSGMRDQLDAKLNTFRDISWHSLVAPAILAFSLISPILCVSVNGVYGLVLFTYYFFRISPESVDYCADVLKKPKSPCGNEVAFPSETDTSKVLEIFESALMAEDVNVWDLERLAVASMRASPRGSALAISKGLQSNNVAIQRKAAGIAGRLMPEIPSPTEKVGESA